jgi:DNA-binding PadR family transcriptional regulator
MIPERIMASSAFTERIPLKPPVLHILLALSSGELHGLGIADQVEEASGGVVTLGPGTLYRSLDEMEEAKLVERAAAPDADADPRRKYYRITRRGEGLLQAEMERLNRMVALARARHVLPEGV